MKNRIYYILIMCLLPNFIWAQDIGALGNEAAFYGNKLPDSAHVYLFHELNGDSILQFKEAFSYNEKGQTIHYEIAYYEQFNTLRYVQGDSIGYDQFGNRSYWYQYRKDIQTGLQVPIAKARRIFSEQNKLTELQLFLWDEEINDWFNYAQSKYFFNEQGYLDSDEEWFSPTTSEPLRLNFQNSYYYDENGNDTAKISRNFNQQLELDTLFARDRNLFDETNQIIEKTTYLWDLEQVNWKPRNQYQWRYKEDDFDKIETQFNWRNDDWMPTTKIFQQRDSIDRLIFEEIHNWDRNLEIWEPETRKVFEYHPSNKPNISQNWIYQNEEWIMVDEVIQDYNEFGSETDYINRVFDTWLSPDSLITTFVRKSVYDDNGWGTDVFTDKWDSFIGKLIANSHYQIIYDEDYNKKIEAWNTWKLFEQQYLPSNKRFYYYQTFAVPINDEINTTSHIKLYPQPVIDNLFIELNQQSINVEFKVFDQLGRVVKEGELNKNQSKSFIKMEDLADGVYWIQIFDAEKQYDSKQFIKCRN